MCKYYCKTECGHRGECEGAKTHEGKGCKCGECPVSSHVTIIENPLKLSFPCHHGNKCSCGSNGVAKGGE